MSFCRQSNKIKPALAAALFLAMLTIATISLAASGGEKPITVLIRPELLAGGTSPRGNNPDQGRNPFIWPSGQKSRLAQLDGAPGPNPFESLTLNGIIWVEGSPVVIIDNRQLREGDKIRGIKVKKIARDHVILATAETSRTLRFPSSGVDLNPPPTRVK